MPSQQNLALLVKSLSKTEKRYFKLMAAMQNGSKYYLSLFDFLENDNLKLEDIKEKFQKKHKGIVYDSACKHLYKVLMKSLRSYEGDTKTELRLSNLYQEIKILYDKEIFDEFLFQVEKLKELALQNEKYTFYLQVAALEMEYYTRKDFDEISEDKLVEKQSEIEGVLEHLSLIRSHSALYEMLLHRSIFKGVVRSDEEKDRLNDLMLSESQFVMNPKYDTFESNKLHLLFQSVYFKVTGDTDLGLEVYQELDHLFEKNKVLWIDSPLYFVNLMEGIILTLINVQKYDAVPYFINRLEKISAEITGLEVQILPLLFQFEILILIGEKRFDQAGEVIEKFENKIKNRLSELTPNSAARVHLYSAIALIGTAQYKASLKALNRIFDLREKLINPELFVVARLVRMIVYFEMGSNEFLEYDIRSLERKLQKKGRFYKTEKIMVSLLKKISVDMDRKELKRIYTSYSNQLSDSENTPFEMQLSKLFNFKNWIDFKLSLLIRK